MKNINSIGACGPTVFKFTYNDCLKAKICKPF